MPNCGPQQMRKKKEKDPSFAERNDPFILTRGQKALSGRERRGGGERFHFPRKKGVVPLLTEERKSSEVSSLPKREERKRPKRKRREVWPYPREEEGGRLNTFREKGRVVSDER